MSRALVRKIELVEADPSGTYSVAVENLTAKIAGLHERLSVGHAVESFAVSHHSVRIDGRWRASGIVTYVLGPPNLEA